VALVCSWLNQYGGAERVLEVLHAMYPEAPLYTSMYWPQAFPAEWGEWDVRPTALDRLPLIHRRHQWFLPLYPVAFGQLALEGYDLVLSVSSGFAHGVVTPSQTLHICYCLTPPRFLWNYESYVRRENLGVLARHALPPLIRRLQQWDRRAAERVDHFVAISQTVQERIARVYQREADVIYPPADVQRFSFAGALGDHYLIVSRLVPYKNIDLAVKAFNELGQPLWIIGDGRDRQYLEALAEPNVRFLGRVSDAEAAQYLSSCKALILPGEEDFGIAPVEAQAAGRPVIAFGGGGALETVVEGTTGIFFRETTARSIVEAVGRLERTTLDSAMIRQHAQRFARERFVTRLRSHVRELYAAFVAA
jgi:glycosyltransferase involved in cell wall biosynthesis